MGYDTSEVVTHPAEGVYLSKLTAGVLTAVLTASLLGGFTNLWYLNEKIIAHDQVLRLQAPLTKSEWALEKAFIVHKLEAIESKIDKLADEND